MKGLKRETIMKKSDDLLNKTLSPSQEYYFTYIETSLVFNEVAEILTFAVHSGQFEGRILLCAKFLGARGIVFKVSSVGPSKCRVLGKRTVIPFFFQVLVSLLGFCCITEQIVAMKIVTLYNIIYYNNTNF